MQRRTLLPIAIAGTESRAITAPVLKLAAQALERDFRLLTANGKDFADIPGLDVTVVKPP
jgi:predicted nucleic acid-binding protein